MNNKLDNHLKNKAISTIDYVNQNVVAHSEVQSSVLIAKQFKRDQVSAVDNILNMCTRYSLAENAIYSYPRGSSTVSGPSIRLAEAIAQSWGNIEYGIKEISSENNCTLLEAYAYDLESNTRVSKTFSVKHERTANNKTYKIKDNRDIYEHVASSATRRLRSCILSVIPIDVIEAAVNQCNVTVSDKASVDKESIQNLKSAFDEVGVSSEQLSRRIGGRHLSTMSSQELIQLRRIYRSIKDGMANPSQFFDEVSKATEIKERAIKKERQENIKNTS